MDPIERQKRADDAKMLLDHPLMRECFDKVERQAVEAMLEASTNKERRWAADTVRAIRSVRLALRTVQSVDGAARRTAANVA